MLPRAKTGSTVPEWRRIEEKPFFRNLFVPNPETISHEVRTKTTGLSSYVMVVYFIDPHHTGNSGSTPLKSHYPVNFTIFYKNEFDRERTRCTLAIEPDWGSNALYGL